MPTRFHHLERLAAALADAVDVDDVARAALERLTRIEGVVRAGVAVSQGAGRELAFVSSDEESLGPHGVRWCMIDGLADVPVARAVRTARAVLLRSETEMAEEFPGVAERQRRLGVRGLAAVPMVVDGGCVGALLIATDRPLDLAPDQRAFLDAFTAQVSQALRRGLAYRAQHTTSEELQRSLMPHALPDLPGLELGAYYRAGGEGVDIGGDWYDVIPLAGGSVAVVLGDVMGKGVRAAVVMSEVRTATRAFAMVDPDPPAVLQRLDRMLEVLPVTEGAEQVVTMLYGVVAPDRTTMRLSGAGHPPPLHVTAEGRPSLVEGGMGPLLGLGAGEWPTTEVPLGAGSSVLFYSDGLVESRGRDLDSGIDRLRDVVAALDARRRNPRELCARVARLMADEDQPLGRPDDVTVLGLTAADRTRSASRHLPQDASAAGLARSFVTRTLEEWAVAEDVVGTAELCVSELVTNVVIHAGTPSTVSLRTDEEFVLMTVQDHGGPGRVRVPDRDDVEAISGRGLSLVEALTSAWSVEESTDGTLVWCEIPLT